MQHFLSKKSRKIKVFLLRCVELQKKKAASSKKQDAAQEKSPFLYR